MKTHIIVAQGFEGHRLFYVRILLDHLRASEIAVVVITSKGVRDSPEYSIHLKDVASSFDLVECVDVNVYFVHEMVSSLDASITFIEGDDWVLPLLRFKRRWPTRGTLLILRSRAQSGGRVLRPFLSLVKAILRKLLFFRGLRVLTLVSANGALRTSLDVRDPVAFSANSILANTIRQRWKSATGGEVDLWVGVVGAISERKNIPLVSRAIAELDNSRVGFILAGKADARELDIENWLEPVRLSGKATIRIADTLDAVTFDSIIYALDCVVIAHSNEGPSGIFGKALLAGTPIVAAGAQSLRDDALLEPSIAEWVRLDVDALNGAISRAIARGRGSTRSVSTSNFAQKLLD